MIRALFGILGMALMAANAACDRAPAAKAPAASTAAGPAGYLSPPLVTGGVWSPGGVTLTGTAAPGAQVGLTSPSGARLAAATDATGRWTATLAEEPSPAIYGLAMELEGRAIQSEGYLLLTPEGRVWQLRAGAGARLLAGPPAGGLTALDFDAGGAVIVSGQVRPETPVAISVDGRPAMQARSGADGRLSVTLAQPLTPGGHVVALSSEANPAQQAAFTIDAQPPALAEPMRTERQDGRWRIDWLTPGGGVQTTLLMG